jgi:aromatic-amino-acid transaminase
LTDRPLAEACDRQRGELKALLGSRVKAWNELAGARSLRYPRYEGGFFVTVFMTDADKHAVRMKERGVFVVPQGNHALRVALCGVAAKDVARVVDALASPS